MENSSPLSSSFSKSSCRARTMAPDSHPCPEKFVRLVVDPYISVLPFLTLHSIVQLPICSKSMRDALRTVAYADCRDAGTEFAVPFPGFPGLFRPNNNQRLWAKDDPPVSPNQRDGLFQHQLASFLAIWRAENPEGPVPFGMLFLLSGIELAPLSSLAWGEGGGGGGEGLNAAI